MFRFSSVRERWLWLVALSVVVAIYATLGLAGALAEALGEAGLLTPFFALGMVLVGAVVLIHGLSARPRGFELGVALGVATAYFMLFVRLSTPERSHLIEYSILAVLISAALAERQRQGRRVPVRPILAVGATALLGTIDELIQLFLPSRVFDPVDILFNFLAAVLAVAALAALGWARRIGGSGK